MSFKKRLVSWAFDQYYKYLSLKVRRYKKKNANAKKILIYTDSRGHEITKLTNKHNPFSGYAGYFIERYNCDVFICPEKHTTFFDFLSYIEAHKEEYDHIICHVGVVDFAPRSHQQAIEVWQLKEKKIKTLFGSETFQQLIEKEPMETIFEGQPTAAIVPDFLIDPIGKLLNSIEHLIWISCTPIDVNWRGNYHRDRPKNSNIVNSKSVDLINNLGKAEIVNFTNIDRGRLQFLTCDNVHLTEEGMNEIEDQLRKIIE